MRVQLGLAIVAVLRCGALEAQQIATIHVTPAEASVVAGQSARFQVEVLDQNGQRIASPVTWLATPFDIAAADSTGRVDTSRPGHVLVLALAGGKVGTASLEIRERPAASLSIVGPDTIIVGETVLLGVHAATSVGDPVSVSPVGWKTSNPAVLQVDPATGVMRGQRPGSTTVTADFGQLDAKLPVVVRPNQAARLSISGPPSAAVGEVIQFQGWTAPRTGGRASQTPPQVWGVQGGGATITPTGAFVASAPGIYTITAAIGSVAATTVIRVSSRDEMRRVEFVGTGRFPQGIQAGELWLNQNAAYVTSIGDKVYVFDISNPQTPVLTDSMVADARLINDVTTTADGKTGVFSREGASNRKNGLVLFDASNPLHPRIITEYSANLEGGVHSAFVDDHYVYATHDPTGSLRIIDIANPAKPVEVGRYELPRDSVRTYDVEFLTMSPQRYLHDVYVKDGLAYLAYWKDGLVILDVGRGIRGGSPSHPVLVGRFQYNHAAIYPPLYIAGTHAVFVSGKYAFVGDEVLPGTVDLFSHDPFPTRGRLHVVDISDLANPKEVAWYDGGEFGVHNLWVEDGVLYIGAYTGGLRVLDVTGDLLGDLRAQGREIGSLYTGATDGFRINMPLAWSAIPHNGYVFVSDINSGLWVAKVVGEAVTP